MAQEEKVTGNLLRNVSSVKRKRNTKCIIGDFHDDGRFFRVSNIVSRFYIDEVSNFGVRSLSTIGNISEQMLRS